MRQTVVIPITWLEYTSTGTKRIAELEHRYANLTVDNQKLRELEKENQQLRDKLNMQERGQSQYLPSSLILTEFAAVPVGIRDGVRDGAAVIADGMLIGRIETAGFTYSKVLLLQNSAKKMRVKISDSEIEGVLVRENNQLFMDFISSEHEIPLSSTVVTIGELPGILPGLPIGTLVEVVSSSSDPVQKARIETILQPKQHISVFIYAEERK